MKTSPASTGDLGEFIIAELHKRGISLSKPDELPRLPATWRAITVEIAGAAQELGVGAQGCSLSNVLKFCSSLLSPLRVNCPFSKDNDRNFWFSIDGKQGSCTGTDTGLVISFIPWGVALTVSESNKELHVGFAKLPVNPAGVPHK